MVDDKEVVLEDVTFEVVEDNITELEDPTETVVGDGISVKGCDVVLVGTTSLLGVEADVEVDGLDVEAVGVSTTAAKWDIT